MAVKDKLISNECLKAVNDYMQGAITDYDGMKILPYEAGYINCNSATININSVTSDNNYKHVLVACSEGDVFLVRGFGALSAKKWCFVASDGTRLTYFDGPDSTASNGVLETVVAPANSAYLIAHCKISSSVNPIVIQSVSAYITDRIDDLNNDLYQLANISGASIFNTTWTNGYINDSGATNGSDNFRRTTQAISISSGKYLNLYIPETYSIVFVSLYKNNTYLRNEDVSSFPYKMPVDADSMVINVFFNRVVSNDIMGHSVIAVFDYKQEDYLHSIDRFNFITEMNLMKHTYHQYYDVLSNCEIEQGKFNTDTGAKSSSTTQYRTANKISLPVGTTITVIALGSNANRAVQFFEYDLDSNFINEATVNTFDTYGIATYTTTQPYINFGMYTASYTSTDVPNMYRILVLQQSELSGKKISVYGDSLSTFDGFSDHDTAYYPTTGLSSVSQTYWGIVSNILGLTIDTVNAIGGSYCTSQTETSLSSDTRLADLGTPDIIILCAGTNDIYSNSSTGEWSGDDAETLATTTFIPAFTKIIKVMQTSCPDAKIVVISPCFIDQNNIAERQYCTIENVQRICEAEKLVCDYMGVPFIDARKIGMNTSNIADYTIDKLHWNYNFTKLLADKLIDVLSE